MVIKLDDYVWGWESPAAAWIVALDVEAGRLMLVWSAAIHITGSKSNSGGSDS